MLTTQFSVLQLALLKMCPEDGLGGGAEVAELFSERF